MTKVKGGVSGTNVNHGINQSNAGAKKSEFRLIEGGTSFVSVDRAGLGSLSRAPFLNESQRKDFFANLTKESLQDPSHPYSGFVNSLDQEEYAEFVDAISTALADSHFLRRSVIS